METMNAWWVGLTALNRWFFVAAAFFSVFLLWQLMGAIMGLSGGESDLDTHVEPTWDHDTPADAHDTLSVFKLLSVRSVLAFFTLFAWAGALYLNQGLPVVKALFNSLLWGLIAMVLMTLLMHLLGRLTQTGTARIASCVGAHATVYLDIPVSGFGEVRVLCNGMVTHLRARVPPGGAALKAGAPVSVRRVLGANIVEVESDETTEARKETPHEPAV